MEKSKEKSEEQAQIIREIAMAVIFLDVEYCREAAKDMMDEASFFDSAAALNPSYSPTISEIGRLKATALSQLCDYVDTLKAIQAAQLKHANEEEGRKKMEKLFNPFS